MQAGDDPDAAREGRQGTLAVEKTLSAQPFLKALHLGKQGTKADLLHPLDDELHLPAALVYAELAVDADRVTV